MSKPRLLNKNFRWTPKLAYTIGLLTTDGNLSKDKRHIDFTSKDKCLVELFRESLNLNNKIGRKSSGSCHKKKYFRIQFGNVAFYRWLQRIGLSPHKSKTIANLKIPDNYFQDFLRGHLDGDGDIVTYTDYYNTYKNPKYVYARVFTRLRSASKQHIEWIRKTIFNLILLKGHLIEQKPQRKNQTTSMWILRFAKKESIKLLSWLYYNKNVPCLLRKRKIVGRFV